jgi:hypothetical protein
VHRAFPDLAARRGPRAQQDELAAA